MAQTEHGTHSEHGAQAEHGAHAGQTAHTEQGGGHGGGHGGGEAEGSLALELPSIFQLVGINSHTPMMGATLHVWTPVFMSLFVGIFLTILSMKATRQIKKIPAGLQAFFELIVGGLDDFFQGVIGHTAHDHLPFLGTLFIYIIVMNFWGLIPSMHSPTNTLNTTMALGMATFVYVQYQGISKLGIKKYFMHFIGEPLFLGPLMFPLHVVGELVKPISLALRLYGNLLGEDIALALLVGLAAQYTYGLVPFHLVMVILALLFSTIQAIVFSLLSAIYIGQSTGVLGGGEH